MRGILHPLSPFLVIDLQVGCAESSDMFVGKEVWGGVSDFIGPSFWADVLLPQVHAAFSKSFRYPSLFSK